MRQHNKMILTCKLGKITAFQAANLQPKKMRNEGERKRKQKKKTKLSQKTPGIKPLR